MSKPYTLCGIVPEIVSVFQCEKQKNLFAHIFLYFFVIMLFIILYLYQ